MHAPTSRSLSLVFATCAALLAGGSASAVTILFAEDFSGVPLVTSPTYGVANAISRQPPPGWDIVDNLPSGGVPEWAGWSFARKGFWQTVGATFGDRTGRGAFTRGVGTIAVADSDLWNTLPPGNDPANRLGYYNTVLLTPPIDLSPRPTQDNRLRLALDSSWLGPECCDDGDLLPTPIRNRNNQTAVVRARLNGGPAVELVRWESARYREPNGAPSASPLGPGGSANLLNPNYRPLGLNERLFVDLSGLLNPSTLTFSPEFAAMMAGGDEVQIELAVEDAGDDGWWAVDNVEMASFATLLGDMNLSGALDVGDYDAFALGMLDTEAYRDAFWGTFPAENGSLDSVFDFGDIPWFVAVMKDVAPPPPAFAMALMSVPEPTGIAAMLVAMVGPLSARRRRR